MKSVVYLKLMEWWSGVPIDIESERERKRERERE
jgi:hypothetical protein